MRIIAVVKKNYDFIELEAMLDKHKPNQLRLFVYTEKNNIKLHNYAKNVLRSLSLKFKNRSINIEEKYLYIDKIKNGRDIYNIILPFIEGDCIVALPLGNGRYFVDSVKYFNRNPNVTCYHLSDGILDFIPRHKYYFIKNKLSIINLLKSLLSYFKLINNRSEFSFSIFSNYSAFSKNTTKIKPNSNYSKQAREMIDDVMPLVSKAKNGILLIPTNTISKEMLMLNFNLQGLTERIIISSKTGEVVLNNKEYWSGIPISAEELLQTGYISQIYAGPSTAAFYAKELNSDASVTILSSYVEKKYIGLREHNWLKKQSINYGIKYVYLRNKQMFEDSNRSVT
ncbi:MAG: hypothetical protein RPU39_05090 [Candidatus Sedimenticola sp. (ex Thyasira tokunagai)]